jgi:pectate lyase
MAEASKRAPLLLLLVQACSSQGASDGPMSPAGDAPPVFVAPASPDSPVGAPGGADDGAEMMEPGGAPSGEGMTPVVIAPGAGNEQGPDNPEPRDVPGAGEGGGDPPDASAELVAFPGAQGFGRHAVGARGGDVYHVTNLNDSGPGSLRDAISQPNRTVVFEVSGVIQLASRLVFENNQTIAGQTAPGGGITLYGDGTSFSGASNTIVRYVRFRMGRGGESEKDTVTMANGHDVIWDHVSLSWGRDGNFDLNIESGEELYNLTLQDSIVAQGLQTHSTGGLVQTGATSIIRSLYIDNNSRNPKARGTLQFVNNVIYNWVVSGYILGDTAGRSDGYMLNNYFIRGPETNGGTLDSPTPEYQLHASGNYYDSNVNGVLDGRLLAQGDFGTVTWHDAPSVPFPEVPALSAEEALQHVFDSAGASLFRDAADEYVLAELASLGTRGATISDEASLGFAGGVGALPGGSIPADVDRDGMADAWETANGLSPANAADRNADRNADGWTNLEEYINSLAR